VTLIHEHLLHRISLSSGRPDNECTDREMIVEELLRYKAGGGGAVCDATPAGLGRDPQGLREVSLRSGVKIVSGIGLYLVKDFPEEVRDLPPDGLAGYLVREAEGADTGIPAGLIGEIATHNEDHADWRRYRLTEREEDLFTAAAMAQKRTGLCVSTHASLGRGGMAQARTLLKGGAEPTRVIIGHCDAQWSSDPERDMEYYLRLLAEGVLIAFDMFGWEELMPDEERCRRVGMLVREGHSDRLVLSTDTCRRSQLHRQGGRGFDFLFRSILPGLSRAGVDERDLRQMTVLNPARILSRTD